MRAGGIAAIAVIGKAGFTTEARRKLGDRDRRDRKRSNFYFGQRQMQGSKTLAAIDDCIFESKRKVPPPYSRADENARSLYGRRDDEL